MKKKALIKGITGSALREFLHVMNLKVKLELELELIEVQVGAYLGENNIVRFDDQYGRETEKL
jgi:hypothetical protein